MFQFLLDHQGTALTMLGSFGFGAMAHRIGLVLGWFKSPQGQAIESDLKAALPIVYKTLADSGHPASGQAIATISSVVNALPSADPAPTAPKVGALLLVFLLLGSVAHAQYAVSVGGLLGSSTWDVSDGGAWVASGSTVAGGEVNLAYGNTDATGTFQPLFVLVGGLGGENKNGSNYANALLGGGAVIPNTTVPLVLAADWRCFSGKQYPGVMLGATFAFGKPIWVSK